MPHNYNIAGKMPVSGSDEPVVRPSSPMPKGYVFVKKGNVYITKNCRQLTQQAGRTVYIVQNEKKTTLGIRVPQYIRDQVHALNTATAADRAAAVAKKDEALENRTKAELLRLFPKIPHEKVPIILKHTLQKRSGRVGRTTDLPLREVVVLAVRAHARHRCTDYDVLLRKGVSREQARRQIQSVVDLKVKDWGGSGKTLATKGSAKNGEKASKSGQNLLKLKSAQAKENEAPSTSKRNNAQAELVNERAPAIASQLRLDNSTRIDNVPYRQRSTRAGDVGKFVSEERTSTPAVDIEDIMDIDSPSEMIPSTDSDVSFLNDFDWEE